MGASKQGGKGKPKTPGSGRKPGTPNKSTTAARERLADLGMDPLEQAVKIYQGKIKFDAVVNGKAVKMPASEQTRVRCLIECLDRQYPKLKAVEHTTDGEGFTIVLRPFEDLPVSGIGVRKA